MADTAVIWLRAEEERDGDWLVIRVLTDGGSEVGVWYIPMLPEYLEAGDG